jgi:citrate lyase beta subunit
MQSRNGPHTIQKRKGPPAPRRAERILAAFDASATGVVQIDGVMLDAPHRAQAHRIMTSFERG